MLQCEPNVHIVEEDWQKEHPHLKSCHILFTEHQNKSTTLKQHSVKHEMGSGVFERYWWDPTATALTSWPHKYLEYAVILGSLLPPWNSMQATCCERLVGEEKNSLSQGKTSVEMQQNVVLWCTNDLWTIYPLIFSLVYLSKRLSSSVNSPSDIRIHRALLVGRAHRKNIKAQFIEHLNKKHAVWLLCLGL